MTAPRRDLTKDRLGLWSLYFAGKVFLYLRHHLGFDLLWNLVFFAFLLATAPGPAGQDRRTRLARQTAAAVAALLLLWRDSWLPSLTGELELLRQGTPRAGFTLAFLGRSLLAWDTLALVAVLAAVAWTARRVHLTWVLLASFFIVRVLQTSDANLPGLDERLQSFYKDEASRGVTFSPLPADASPFDVVVLHLCSLSGDDLSAAHLSDDAFWSHFDVLLTNFNTVTAHSTPAALRLLRAPCGQVRHDELYRVPPADCSLFLRLRSLGYRTYVANDNPATVEGFSQALHDYGRLETTPPPADLPRTLVNYDGSPIFDEGEALARWWTSRMASNEPRAALYSNVVTLHGGAHAPNEARWWRRSREESYRRRFAVLREAVARFEASVSASDKRVALIVVPEHGAALRGSSMLPPDLRELPLPYLTVAPVGIKLIGWGAPSDGALQLRNAKRTTYLALASFISSLLRDPALGGDRARLERIVADLPQTSFVAENQGAVVLNERDGYYLRTAARGWHLIPNDALPGAGRRP